MQHEGTNKSDPATVPQFGPHVALPHSPCRPALTKWDASAGKDSVRTSSLSDARSQPGSFCIAGDYGNSHSIQARTRTSWLVGLSEQS